MPAPDTPTRPHTFNIGQNKRERTQLQSKRAFFHKNDANVDDGAVESRIWNELPANYLLVVVGRTTTDQFTNYLVSRTCQYRFRLESSLSVCLSVEWCQPACQTSTCSSCVGSSACDRTQLDASLLLLLLLPSDARHQSSPLQWPKRERERPTQTYYHTNQIATEALAS